MCVLTALVGGSFVGWARWGTKCKLDRTRAGEVDRAAGWCQCWPVYGAHLFVQPFCVFLAGRRSEGSGIRP